jgi:2-amino-4-hydroxy-6-hydroxymethyldihydropteridine diphosphokinase
MSPESPQVTAYVGIGANLEDPTAKVRTALDELGRLPATVLVRSSSLYRTAPVGYLDQPDFINAVAQLRTGLAAEALLRALLGIEARHGRVRSTRNAPRTLDLDLLLFGEQIMDEPGLVLPHPRMHERAFVLVPLAEVAPDALIPGHGRAADLLARAAVEGVSRLGPA